MGIPLSVQKLERAAIQTLVDKVADHLPTWKGRLLYSGGRLLLTKVTLSAIPVYISIALVLPPWAIKAIEKIMRAILWTSSETVVAGKCLVAWPGVIRPYAHGGLGIIDLKLFGFALRAHWHWLKRTDASKMWADLPIPEERQVTAMCAASITVTVGDGRSALF